MRHLHKYKPIEKRRKINKLTLNIKDLVTLNNLCPDKAHESVFICNNSLST